LQQYPGDDGLRAELARDEIQLGAPEKALPDLQRIVAAQPDAIELRYTLAIALSAAGRYSEAIAHLDRIVEELPGYFLGWVALAEAHWGLVHHAEWQNAVERAWAISSSGPVSHRLRGDLWFLSGRLDEAQACYQRALAIHPRHYRAHVALGNLCSNRGQVDEAARHFATAWAIAPWDGVAQGSWAQFQETQGKPVDLDSLGEAARKVPHNRLALSLGRIWRYVRRDAERAREWFTFVAEQLPEEAQALAELGRLGLERGDADAALHWSERLVKLSPRHGGGWYSLAHAAARKGDVETARVAFAHAVELLPDQASVHQGYGLALLTAGRVEEAARELQRAVELAPEDGQYAFTLALGLEKAERLAEARAAAERARSRLPGAHPGLAELLARLAAAGAP
jgi:tetratricopeptide (TPR) repeat protein